MVSNRFSIRRERDLKFIVRLSFVFCLSLSFVRGFVSESNAGTIDWPVIGFTQAVATTFSQPTCITHAGDGSQRIFVTERKGHVQVIQNSNILAQPFLDITNRVMTSGAEQGLLGLAFPAGFSTNGHFYVDYTRAPDGAVVISRFQISNDPNVADSNSEQIIKVISKPFNNHNGGQIAFGPDGYFYIGVGDGGSEGDPMLNGQRTSTFLGKLLRIDVESGATPYAVPTNNPFVGNTNYLPEIWALGLRNPWRFSFDRLTGDLYIGDVGQNRYEEIDFQPAGSPGGQNYGWRIMEGASNNIVPAGFTNFTSLTLPVAWYSHLGLPSDIAASVTGGYVYRGPSEPRMDGLYFYGDFVVGWLWALKQVETNWQSKVLLSPGFGPPGSHLSFSTFGEDESGQLYTADYSSGKIYRIQDTHQAWPAVFSPTNGIINSNRVLVTCPTLGVEIHYTSSGMDPTVADPFVASGETIMVATGLTNKLRAFRSDLSASAVTAAIFTNKVGTPFFSPLQGPVTNGTQISITTVTPDATIYYTTNGSTPTTASLVYSGPLTFHTNILLMALGVESGYSNSSVASANFTLAQVATPVFVPPSGPITNGTVISISCATPQAIIYYTTNGATPTTNSIVYSGPFMVQGNTRVQAVGILENYANSVIKNVFFDLVKVATPTFDPPQGPTKAVSIACATSNALVHYTLDGSDPTTNSPVYSSPIVLNALTTITARGFRSDLAPSDPLSVSYGLLNMESTVVTTLAGSTTAGFSNAVGMLAKFYYPVDACLDTAGNIYVADSGNNVIRKITPSGAVTTFAGTGVEGTQNGTVTNAQFSGLNGICLDSKGNFYVQETPCGSWRVRKIDTNLNVTTFVSTGGNCGDFRTMEMGPDGNLYVGFQGSVQKVLPNGANSIIAGPGDCSGGWCFGVGVTVDNLTNVYAATEERLWRIPPGQPPVTFAGSNVGTGGFSDGPRLQALFGGPLDAAFVATGDIFVSDRTCIRRIRPDGVVTTMAGRNIPGYVNGRGADARFNLTVGICVDPGGNIYAVDNGNNCIRKISPDTAGIGIADDWQLAHFGYVGIDPNADPDHDGLSNFGEFWAGTDPLDANSSLAIDPNILANNAAQIQWQTVAGKSYTVEYSADLKTWNSLGGPVLGDGSIASVTDTVPISQLSQRFYRIRLTEF